MKSFAPLKPDDAEVLRNGKWIRYDATSLVRGDVIRLEEGDIVPADCVVVAVHDDTELLVDVRAVAGDERLRSASAGGCEGKVKLYLGAHVVQGSATAVITAIGSNTLLATLIQEGRFPPKEIVVEDEVEGISLTKSNIS
jgi:magnesium-transporting ATPase (P-type)